MGNATFKTIPGTIDIPTDLGAFKLKEQVVWSGSQWRKKGAFSPNYGFTGNFPSDDESGYLNRQDTMYASDRATSGLEIKWSAGNRHYQNYEQYGDGRWIPASVFNGIGFEIYQSSDSQHALYVAYYALVFASKTGGTYRTFGVDTGARGPYKGFRYLRIASNSASTNTIRSWGSSWVFQGIILHVYNDGGAQGSQNSTVNCYNMRVGSKMSTLGGQYRMLPAGKRPYSKRNVTGNAPFTDLFAR